MKERLLTTDELLNLLEESTTEPFQIKLKHQRKKKTQYYIFWSIVAIAVLHLLLLGLPLFIGVRNTVNLVGHARVIGIPYIEGTVTEREGHVIVLNPYDIENIVVNDHVVVYGLLDTEYYWEVIITAYNDTNETVSISYDGLYTIDLTYDDIEGVYVRDANLLGVILFVSSRWRGLLATTVVYSSLIFIFYVLVIREMKVIKKETINEQEGK